MAPVPMKDECEQRESVCQWEGEGRGEGRGEGGCERKEGVLVEKNLYLIAIVPVFFNQVMSSLFPPPPPPPYCLNIQRKE